MERIDQPRPEKPPLVVSFTEEEANKLHDLYCALSYSFSDNSYDPVLRQLFGIVCVYVDEV